jgi:hypothetical protein
MSRRRRNGTSSGNRQVNERTEEDKIGVLVIGEALPIVCSSGIYDSREGSFSTKGPSLGFEAGLPLLVEMLSSMQDITIQARLPVSRLESVQLYRDFRKGTVCSSVHPCPIYDEEDVEQALHRACQLERPPHCIVLVDTGSGAWDTTSIRIIKPFVDAWNSPIFLLSLGNASRISTAFDYTAVVRQAYTRHDSLCTCLCNRLYIHDRNIGGFCNSNTFSVPDFPDSKAPCMGLGEMAMAYIVSEYARDASFISDLGRSLAFIKHAFTSMPAEKLVMAFGRTMVKDFKEQKENGRS